MAVATSAIWSIPNDDVVDAAFARLGGERTGGWEAKSALRNMQLLLQYFESRRVNLWRISLRRFGLVEGQGVYPLGPDVIDVLDLGDKTTYPTGHNTEIPIERVSRTDWFLQTDKTAKGRPTLYWLDRQRDAPVIRFWPVPDRTERSIEYAAATRLRDVGALSDDLDAPRRWLPAVISGLALYLGRERGMRLDDIGALIREQLPRLKQEFDDDFRVAQEEDRDSEPVAFDVDLSFYYR